MLKSNFMQEAVENAYSNRRALQNFKKHKTKNHEGVERQNFVVFFGVTVNAMIFLKFNDSTAKTIS